jgi:hypothetical protein
MRKDAVVSGSEVYPKLLASVKKINTTRVIILMVLHKSL